MIIWWTGILLELLILWRGLQTRLFRNFALFYSFLAALASASLLRYPLYRLDNALYDRTYWISDCVLLVLTACVFWEFIRHVMLPHDSSRRFAFIAGGILLCATGVYAMAFIRQELSGVRRATNYMALERDLFAVHASLLVLTLGVVLYYGLEVSRNLKSIYLGYGLAVDASLAVLAVWLYVGRVFDRAGQFLSSASFDVALAIWLAGLWTPDAGLAMDAKQDAKSSDGSITSGVISAGTIQGDMKVAQA